MNRWKSTGSEGLLWRIAGRKEISLVTFFLLFTGLFVGSLTAQQRWDELQYPPLNPFEKPDIETFELDNGIRFYLLEDDELPLITVNVMVRTGGVEVPDRVAGLEGIIAEVLEAGGTLTTPAAEIQEILENHAARLSVSVGLQSADLTLNFLREDVGEMLPLLAELMREPAFPENQIELAKTRMRSMVSRRNDDSGQIARREFRRLIYGPGSVYGRFMEYETIDRIERDDLVRFHENAFVGSNLMVGISGDFDRTEMKRLLDRAFSDIPHGGGADLDFPEPQQQPEPGIYFIDKRDINQSTILIGHLGGLRDNPDYAALQVMNRVLSGGFSGRLFQIVRSEMGLAYAVFGSYGSNWFYPGLFSAGVLTRSEATADAIGAVLREIRRLQEERVGERELQQTRDRFLNSLVFEYESRQSVLRERMQLEYAGMDPDTFDRYVEEVRKVTADDILRVARHYRDPDGMAILVVGNGEELGGQLENIGEVRKIDITIPEPESGSEERGNE